MDIISYTKVKELQQKVETMEQQISNLQDMIVDLDDYIITLSASNSNGWYIQFGEGTQICGHTMEADSAIDTAFGSVFSTESTTWAFPTSFASGTKPFVSAFTVETAGTTWAGLGSSVVSENTMSFKVFRGSSTTAIPKVGLLAIGRWK